MPCLLDYIKKSLSVFVYVVVNCLFVSLSIMYFESICFALLDAICFLMSLLAGLLFFDIFLMACGESDFTVSCRIACFLSELINTVLNIHLGFFCMHCWLVHAFSFLSLLHYIHCNPSLNLALLWNHVTPTSLLQRNIIALFDKDFSPQFSTLYYLVSHFPDYLLM